jgi:hypothetical protein
MSQKHNSMRRRILVGSLMLVVLAGAVLLFSRLTAPQVGTQLNVGGYSRIQKGMALSEVEELFGGPAGKYGRYAGGISIGTEEGYMAPPGSVELAWCDDSHRFEIYFDKQKRVVGYHERIRYEQKPGPGWLERLQAWLGV